MNLFYNTAIHLYAGAARAAALRSAKVKRMIAGQRVTRHDPFPEEITRGGAIWIHAASLGEFEQGRPMIERLRSEHPERPILLTFFSPSGYDVRKNYDKVDHVAYLPFDTPRNARQFIDAVKPSMAIFVKYEFWGNFLSELHERHIPTYIISAIFRPSQIFFKKCGHEMRKVLRCFDTLYVQDDASKRLLAGIGIDNVKVAGDTRFDRVTDVMKTTFEMPAVEEFFKGSPLRLIVGSSWEADEDLYIPWLNAHPEVKAVIAPHEMKDGRVEALVKRFEGGAVTLSEVEDGTSAAGAQVLIVDSFGKLASLYRYGNAAYIGGGFGAGIHNINEAAVYGMPVVFGPKYQKFKEARDLIEVGGAVTVNGKESVSAALDSLLDDKTRQFRGRIAGDYIRRNLGATDIIYNDLFK